MTQEWLPYKPVAYDRDMALDCDVCVVGTGAGGAVFASEMAEAGYRVVMLEKGGLYTRKDFTQREDQMMPLLFEDGGLRTTADGGVVILHGNCVGGSTTINWAICFDPPEAVLAEWGTTHGVEGVSLTDMRPSLAKVRHVLNVQRMDENEVNENARLLIAGATKLGLHAQRFEHSRTACLGSGFCILGCAYDRKQSMLVTYVPRAMHFGAQLLANAEVTGFSREGSRVTAANATLTDPRTGNRYQGTVKAKLFAVAGGAIGTPVLLEKAGLAPSSRRLGENLTIHPTSAVMARFKHRVGGFEGIHFGAYVSDLEPEGIILEAIFAYPGLLASSILGGGRLAQEELMPHYENMAGGIVLLHDDGRGRVRVDRHGRPRIDYTVSPRDQAKFRRGFKTMARIYFAAGAEAVMVPHISQQLITSPEAIDAVVDSFDIAPNRVALFSAHQMGTAAMGGDPATSATDSDGRVWGLDNMLVVDGSLMPTSLGVNPQITIAALGDRAARRVLAKQDRYLA